MKTHELSQEDRDFRSAFEACTVTPAQFNHEAHVRLAYVYLVESDVDSAVHRMREALLGFLDHNGIPRSKFHETMTRAWVLAVRHFMNESTSTSAADFIAKNQELLDSKIMLTHYSASVLFSSDARSSFVEPDLVPIPHQDKRSVISRHWRGLSKPEHAEAYVEHLQSETFPALRKIPGFLSASILRRRTEGGVEFLVVTQWSSMKAIREFAGTEAETAVVPPNVRDMMVEYDHVVRHYEVVD